MEKADQSREDPDKFLTRSCHIHLGSDTKVLGWMASDTGLLPGAFVEEKEEDMLAQALLITICIALMAYLSSHLYALDRRRREEARNARMRQAVDWTRPPNRKTPKPSVSRRISDLLKI